MQIYLYVANEFVFVLLKNLPDGTSDFFFQNSLKMKKKMFRVCAFVTRSRLIAHLTLTYL